jgi:hypothetical protein
LKQTPFSKLLLYMENICILPRGISKIKSCMCQKDSFMQIKLSLILNNIHMHVLISPTIG